MVPEAVSFRALQPGEEGAADPGGPRPLGCGLGLCRGDCAPRGRGWEPPASVSHAGRRGRVREPAGEAGTETRQVQGHSAAGGPLGWVGAGRCLWGLRRP